MIVHVVTDRFMASSFQPFIYYGMSFLMVVAPKIPLQPFSGLVRFLFVSIWKIMHFLKSVLILSWGLFMSGIPRTFIIKIASNKITVIYPVMQDFQQIRYPFPVQLPLQLDILEHT